MEEYGAGLSCPMGICLASGCPHANRNKSRSMKSDMSSMEQDISSDDKESAEIKRRNAKLSDYYENPRTNVFSILGPKPVMRVGSEQENLSQEKYDSYLTKLQNICTEQVGEESKPV